MSTWHPSMDTAGNYKPGGFGTVVDDFGIIHHGYTWAEAQEAFPGSVKARYDLPVVIDVETEDS